MAQRMLPYILDDEFSEREAVWRRARAGDAIRKMASRGSVPDTGATGGRKRASGRSRACGEPDAKRRRADRFERKGGAYARRRVSAEPCCASLYMEQKGGRSLAEANDRPGLAIRAPSHAATLIMPRRV